METIGIIINPTSSAGRNKHLADDVINEFESRLPEANYTIVNLSDETYERVYTKSKDLIIKGELDYLIVVGGDGMVHLGVNLVGETDVKLGIIPLGTGNDFAATLKIPLKDWRSAVNGICGSIVKKVHKSLDLGKVDLLDNKKQVLDTKYFAGSLSAGVDSKIVDKTHRMKTNFGRNNYFVAGVIEMIKLKASRYHLEYNGKRLDSDGVLCTVCNSKMFGGGFIVSPESQLDDGYLDLVFANFPGKLAGILLFLQTKTGAHLKSEYVISERVKEVFIGQSDDMPILTADGEYIGYGPVKVSVVPNGFKILYHPNLI
jgi:diacylglycerol kinase (ATP)